MKRALLTSTLALMFSASAAAQAQAQADAAAEATQTPAVAPEAVELTTRSVAAPTAASEAFAAPVDDRVVHVVSDARGLRLRRGSEDFFVVEPVFDGVAEDEDAGLVPLAGGFEGGGGVGGCKVYCNGVGHC